ncbi:hypothetical protein D0C28_25565 [Rhizobium sp. AU243]|nr:hypothetical protein D0C28_25565 [Rhizobium sp. AU243]
MDIESNISLVLAFLILMGLKLKSEMNCSSDKYAVGNICGPKAFSIRQCKRIILCNFLDPVTSGMIAD